MLAVLALAVSCGGDDEMPAAARTILTLAPSVDGGMDALGTGQLDIRADGCVFSVYDNLAKAVVWPQGTTLNSTGDALLLGDGRTIARGAMLQFGGGSVPLSDALESFTVNPSPEAIACAESADMDSVFVMQSDPSNIEVL